MIISFSAKPYLKFYMIRYEFDANSIESQNQSRKGRFLLSKADVFFNGQNLFYNLGCKQEFVAKENKIPSKLR